MWFCGWKNKCDGINSAKWWWHFCYFNPSGARWNGTKWFDVNICCWFFWPYWTEPYQASNAYQTFNSYPLFIRKEIVSHGIWVLFGSKGTHFLSVKVSDPRWLMEEKQAQMDAPPWNTSSFPISHSLWFSVGFRKWFGSSFFYKRYIYIIENENVIQSMLYRFIFCYTTWFFVKYMNIYGTI